MFLFLLDAEELFLVIHNIDGSMLRAKKVSLHSVKTLFLCLLSLLYHDIKKTLSATVCFSYPKSLLENRPCLH